MLSPNSEDRRIAEERKKALEVTDGNSIYIFEVSVVSHCIEN